MVWFIGAGGLACEGRVTHICGAEHPFALCAELDGDAGEACIGY